MRFLPVRTKVEQALAAQVPKGRIFSNGKASVPLVKPSVFLELETAALNAGITPLKLITRPTASGGDQPKPTASKPAAPAEPRKDQGRPRQPCGWADLQVGCIVLTKDPPHADWFEAEVTAVGGPDLFTLRWRDWPELPPVVRRRVQLALMHPARPPDDLPPDLI